VEKLLLKLGENNLFVMNPRGVGRGYSCVVFGFKSRRQNSFQSELQNIVELKLLHQKILKAT